MIYIKDLKDGDYVNDQFVVTSVNKSVTTKGSEYYRLGLKDATGNVNAVKWTISLGDEEIVAPGAIIFVSGVVETYGKNANIQIRIDAIKPVSSEDVITAKFLKMPPVKKEILIERFNAHINSIQDDDLKLLVNTIVKKYEDKLFIYPAAVSVHHDFSSGLLYHTVSMADIASFLAGYYPNVNRDLLITGTILHDMAKTIEFEGDITFKYSLEGKLLGHITMGMAIIRETAKELGLEGEKILLLEHMVLSHHGELEFGSPVLPQTREAILLNLIDNLDSKMAVVEKALEDVKPGEMSQKVFALDNRILYKGKDE